MWSHHAIHRFHQAQLRIRAHARRLSGIRASSPSDIDILNRFYDLRRLSPTGQVSDDLSSAALAIEQKWSALNDKRDHLRGELHSARKWALAEIGTYFGGLVIGSNSESECEAFARLWRQACRFRASHLDGVRMPTWSKTAVCCLDTLGLRIPCPIVFDPDGPMFKAFLKASGFVFKQGALMRRPVTKRKNS